MKCLLPIAYLMAGSESVPHPQYTLFQYHKVFLTYSIPHRHVTVSRAHTLIHILVLKCPLFVLYFLCTHPINHTGITIPPCHKAAIQPRGTKKAFFHPHGFHCEAQRGKTKLFWSPGTIWPPYDKGESVPNPSYSSCRCHGPKRINGVAFHPALCIGILKCPLPNLYLIQV